VTSQPPRPPHLLFPDKNGAFFAAPPQKTGLSASSPRKRRCASCGLSAPIPGAPRAKGDRKANLKNHTAINCVKPKNKNLFNFFDFAVKILLFFELRYMSCRYLTFLRNCVLLAAG
jgi:hypothetical protein